MDANGKNHPVSGRQADAPDKLPRETLSRIERPTAKKTTPHLTYALVFMVFLGGVVFYILYRQSQAESTLIDATQKMATPSVLIVHPELGPAKQQVILPATVQAFMESSVYARVDGYLKDWLVDIGGAVKSGQLLADIETPEVDQELVQAKATAAQAQADLDLAQSTADRWKELLANKTVAQQEYDEKKSDCDAKQAALAAAEANLKRLQDLQAFQKVYAPFDGVVTFRGVDVGNLIAAGSGNSAKELFRVAQTKTLRVFVNVPEYLSSGVVPGTTAKVLMASAPSLNVQGQIVRTAGAIDPSSLTLLVELSVDNSQGRLLPGGYAQVVFDLTLDHPPLVIPANTLIFRTQGAQVGIVDGEGIVHLSKIKIGRDFGTNLEVLEGVSQTDSIILNPSDSLVDGAKVQVEKK